MKRRMLALLLAGMMIVPTSAMSVMAEEETEVETEAAEEGSGEVTELNWEDIESQVEEAGWAGGFYYLGESGLQMWIPDALVGVELTDDDVANGYISYLQNADETCTLSVQYASVDEEVTLDDYMATVEESGAENVTYAVVNGLNAASFDYTESDTTGIAVESEDGEVVVFGFAPASDEEFSSVVSIMIASVQTYDEETEGAEEEAAEEEVVEEETEEEE